MNFPGNGPRIKTRRTGKWKARLDSGTRQEYLPVRSSRQNLKLPAASKEAIFRLLDTMDILEYDFE